MTLREKQSLFTRLVGELISWAYARGYELTLGEAFRTPEQAAWNAVKNLGIVNSLHRQRLAIDFNLFIEGVYQTDSAVYLPLGRQWESMHPLARWGGRFRDGNHFSLEHEGIR